MPREFLTPPSLPEDNSCRSLQIPNDKLWLGIFNSALLDTTYAYNYTQVNPTDLTPEETAAICQQIVWDYFDSICGDDCANPELPEGGGIFRIGLAGHIEQLQDGAWVEPNGDYTLPPPDARTEPTESERICLAATNAANVLQIMYEQSLDDWNNDIEPYAAVVSQTGALGVAALAAAGLVSAGLAFVVFGVFQVFYQIMQFITEDSWDEEFTELLICALIETASDDAGVVTFDYDNFYNRLANAIDITEDPLYLRVFGQVWYMLQWIGEQNLNIAGGTTAIETADCSFCDCLLYEDDMLSGAGANTKSVPYNGITNAWGNANPAGTWQAAGGRTGGGCWNAQTVTTSGGQVKREACCVVDLGAQYTVSYAQMYSLEGSSGHPNTRGIAYFDAAGTLLSSTQSSATSSNSWRLMSKSGDVANVRYVRFFTDTNNSTTPNPILDDISVIYC